MNRVILTGRLTRDAEIYKTNESTVAKYSLAVDRKFNREQQQTDFINVVAWRQQAEFVSKYFRKGQAICICGQIQTRSWTDNNGNKRYATEVIADEASFVEKKEGAQSAKNEASEPSYTDLNSPNFEEISGDEDLPF